MDLDLERNRIGVAFGVGIVVALFYFGYLGGFPSTPSPITTYTTTNSLGSTVLSTSTISSVSTISSTSISTRTTSLASSNTQTTNPYSGRRIGFWIADDDIFTTSSPYGNSPNPQTFFNNYFMTAPNPAAMLWVSGLASSANRAIPSIQEAQWLSSVAALADQHQNIVILMILFVNLSGNSVLVSKISITPGFTLSRTGTQAMTAYSVSGLSPSTSYNLILQDSSHNPLATMLTFTTDSTGASSGTFVIPNEPNATNEPGNNVTFFVVVSGTSLQAQIAIQCDQTSQLTNYMTALQGHRSIFGMLFEPEYFGDTPAIRSSFKIIINNAGYNNLAGQFGSGDPVLFYSTYPYFQGQLQSTPPLPGIIGVHYGETGGPIPPDPQPIWTQSTVLNIVDHSPGYPVTIIIASNDVNNPAGNSFLWASPTLRGWIQNDPYYQTNYLMSP